VGVLCFEGCSSGFFFFFFFWMQKGAIDS